jgi:squalene-associated FAD-dependent desaturase
MRVGVIGGGWAGLAAAVEATRRGHAVTVFEMAPQLGGRARTVDSGGLPLDNGQHILVGAYTATLALLREVGVEPDSALQRLPLTLVDARGRGLALRGGLPALALLRAVLGHTGWRPTDRLALLVAAAGWWRRGFRCDPSLDVARWSASLPAAVRDEVIVPLAVAALNTPAPQASAAVFLRSLRDALFGGPGSADLLLPRLPLGDLLPEPAHRWLTAHGAAVQTGRRVQRLGASGAGWSIDGDAFDAVIVAASPVEAARLTALAAPDWSAGVDALAHQPIATVYLRGEPAARWPAPMLALRGDERSAPAQFAFDLGRLGRAAGLYAYVVSGAADWLDRGVPALEQAALAQARAQTPGRWELVRTLVDRRATFACTPGLRRPTASLAPTLLAAGDYVDSPYPGTLEAAVRSGIAAARALPASAMQNRSS